MRSAATGRASLRSQILKGFSKSLRAAQYCRAGFCGVKLQRGRISQLPENVPVVDQLVEQGQRDFAQLAGVSYSDGPTVVERTEKDFVWVWLFLLLR